jgi:hypothetical protein
VNEETDFRELLKKYIKYISECEGVTFLELRSINAIILFDDNEWEMLEQLEKEVL